MVSMCNPGDNFVEADCRMYQQPDEEDELKRAARAGILLLEKNEELQAENCALQAQLEVLTREKMSLCEKLEEQKIVIQNSVEERKHSYTELNSLELAFRDKSALVVQLVEQEERLRQDLASVQEKCAKLEQRCDEAVADNHSCADKPRSNRSDINAMIPSTSDAGEQIALEYLELNKKWMKGAQEIEALQVQLKNALEDAKSLRRNSVTLSAHNCMKNNLAIQNAELQDLNQSLRYELKEAKKVVNSQQSMIQMYKQIAESRPFSSDCTCNKEHDIPASLGTELLESNARLEKELRDLKMQKHAAFSGIGNEYIKHDPQLSEWSDGVDNHLDEGLNTAAYQNLLAEFRKKDLFLERANQQYYAAKSSQKALEDCNRVAQQEIAKLTEQLQHQMKALVCPRFDHDNSDELSEGWFVEETFYPAPPSDLNSPLIMCLIQHWTSDKAEISRLADWLHATTQKSAETNALRLNKLPSEVAAGFIQLLVPILKEKHGVSITIKRRDSKQIVSDLILKRDSIDGSTTCPTLSESTEEVPISTNYFPFLEQLSTEQPFTEKTESTPDCSQMECMRGVRGVVSRFLRGETQFLYG